MESYGNSNESEHFARIQLEAVTAAILHQMGFGAASESSLSIMTDVTRRYLQKMCTTLRWVSEHCGRTQLSLGDVEYSYRRMGVDVDEMNDYFRQTAPFLPRKPLPRFPVPIDDGGLKKSDVIQAVAPPTFIPSWAPPICALWIKEKLQLHPQPARDPKEIASSTSFALPDFSEETASSLGLSKGRYKPPPTVDRKTIVPMRHNRFQPSRPPSSSSSLSRPPSRPISRIETIKEEYSESKPPSPVALSVDTSMPSSTPMFKRRLGKRKSQDDLSNSGSPAPSPAPPIPAAPMSAIARMRHEQASVSDLLAIATPSSSLRPHSHATEQKPLANIHKTQSTPVLTLASDLARDPGSVVTAALSGRSAPAGPPSPLGNVPRNSSNLNDAPRDDEQPNRVVQMTILRHLFTLDSDLGQELDKAFAHVSGQRNVSPIPEEAPPPSPAVYSIVKQEAPAAPQQTEMRVLPPLKIRINRGGVASTDPSPVDSIGTVVSHSTEDDEDEVVVHRKKRHKKKKKKKRQHEDLARDDQPSPCEVNDSGGIRLTIRLRPPSRPSSNAA